MKKESRSMMSMFFSAKHKRMLVRMVSLLLLVFSFSHFAGCGGDLQEATVDELKVRMKEGIRLVAASRGGIGAIGGVAGDSVDKALIEKDLLDRLAPPKIPWAKMGRVERERYMARSVMPVMLLLFAWYDQDPDEIRGYSNSFSCLSCHGERAANGAVIDTKTFDFSSPSHLFPMDPDNLPTEYDPNYARASMAAFMKSTVMPAMRVLLGQKDANCFTCHTKEQH